METWQLEYIIAAADHKTLTDAARALNVSQSTLSRCISQVSKNIGAPLFYRERRLRLTPAGQQYVEGAKQIMEIKRHTYSLIQSICSPDEERFSIGISPHTGAAFLSCIYDRFQSDYPNVKIDVVEGYSRDLFDMVFQGKLDMAIAIQSDALIQRTGLEFWPLFVMRHLLAIAETNSLAARGAKSAHEYPPEVHLAEFRDIPAITPNVRALGCDVQNQLAKAAGFDYLSICQTSSYQFAIQMTRAFSAYTFLPVSMCQEGLGLRYFQSLPAPDVTKGFYFRRGLQITEGIEHFMYLCVCQQISDVQQSDYVNTLSPHLRDIIERKGGLIRV